MMQEETCYVVATRVSFCDVPRLLSSRMDLVCVQVDGLNNTMLDVLTVAFKEVGTAAS